MKKKTAIKASEKKGQPQKITNALVTSKYKEFLFPGVITYYKDSLPIESGKGAWVKDFAGREYLDFFGGILTVSIGHCEQDIIQRFANQIRKLIKFSTLYPTLPAGVLAEKLAGISPGKLSKSFFTNSGTEADETAVLVAQHYTDAQEIIALRHCYSGRSAMAMSLTAHSS